MKIRPVGAWVFHMEGRTDRQTDKERDIMKIRVTGSNIANKPNIFISSISIVMDSDSVIL